MSQPSAMEIGEPTVFILDPKILRRAGMVELLRSWATNVKVSLVDLPLVTSPNPADALECRMAIINLGNISVDSSTSQRLIENVRSNLTLVPLVLISDREDFEEIVSAVRAGASGFIPTSTEPDIAVRALTFIMGGGSFFPPTALMDLRYGMRFGTDDEKPDPDDSGPPKGGRGPLNILKGSGPNPSNGSVKSRCPVGAPVSIASVPNRCKPRANQSTRHRVRNRPPTLRNWRTSQPSHQTQHERQEHGTEAWKDFGEVFRLGYPNQ
jgi:DNA-binding NarL/FixJ family response regulator